MKEKQTAKRRGVKEEAPEEEKDPLHMTEEELVAKRLKDEANAGEDLMTDEEIAAKKEEEDRKKYGRIWIWDGYFNEKRKE